MTTPHDELPRASFAGIEFPVEKCQVTGGHRYRAHKYPKTDGAHIEKLGREPFQIKMTAIFDVWFNNLPNEDGTGGASRNLWPIGRDTLITVLNAGTTADLVCPHRGTIRALCTNWDHTLEAKVRSGETIDLSFIEDQELGFVDGGGLGSVWAEGMNMMAQVDIEEIPDKHEKNLFQQMNDAINVVRGVIDTGEAYSQLVANKLQRIVDLCVEMDALASSFDPDNFKRFEALQQLWATTIATLANFRSKQSSPATYVVPTLMTIQDVSIALFGDTAQVSSLDLMNNIPNKMRIKAGTQLKFYPKS